MSGKMQRTTTKAGGESWWFWCGGCETHHRYVTKLGEGETGPCWTFDGNEASPTFSPSLLVNGRGRPEDLFPHTTAHRCHLFLRAGMVQYLSDCTHHLAGQTIPVEPPCF